MFIPGINYESTIKAETSSAGRIHTNSDAATTLSSGKETVDTVVKYQTTEGTKARQSAYRFSTNSAAGSSTSGARVSTGRTTIEAFATVQNTAETAAASAQTRDSGLKSSDSGMPGAQTTASFSRVIGSKSATHRNALRTSVNIEARYGTFIGSRATTPSNEPIGTSDTDLSVTRQTLSTESIKAGGRGSGTTAAENGVTSRVTLTSFDTGKPSISAPLIESATRSAQETTTTASNVLGKMNYFLGVNKMYWLIDNIVGLVLKIID